MNRTIPNISNSIIPKDYTLLADNFDWWQEALDMKMPAVLWEHMKEAKEKAIALDDRKKTPIEFKFGDEYFQILPTGGAGGKEFILINADLRFEFSSPNRDYAVIWRATSAGLWQYGVRALIDRVFAILEFEGFVTKSEKWRKLSRADYAFDIEAPSFTNEMIPEIVHQVVCPKEVKARGDFFVRNSRVETLTIGSRKGCQVQVYDKGLEITEMSGKTWMVDIWMNEGYCPEVTEEGKEIYKNVWRLEVRMAGDWLKNRNAKDPEDFLKNMWELITEGLYNRRLTKRVNSDSNKSRWPLHPLYFLAVKTCGRPTDFVPIGYQTTEKRKTLEQMLLANIAGTLRSLATLRLRGAMDSEAVFDLSEVDKAIKEASELLQNDPKHHEKIIKAHERYALVDQAR